jgi:diguanylate cyclase (GGDEF)-like protein
MAFDTFKVMIVDDEPLVLKMYGTALLKQHYQVIEANNGKDALAKAFSEDPDMIILDIMMPGMDGYEVCSRLRATPRTGSIPIMILTSLRGVAARQKAYEMGADDFLTKGEPLDHVDGRIKMLIKQRIVARMQSWLADLEGSASIDNVLRARLTAGAAQAICYIDINGLAAFDERAGYENGERLLWQLARIIQAQVKEEGRGGFAGYYGQDDFVIITTPDRGEPIARAIIRAFDAVVADWNAGPDSAAAMPSVSIGMVLIDAGKSLHPGQVHHAGRTLLRQAKAAGGSAYRMGKI